MAAPAPRADSVSGASVGEHTFLKRPQHVVAVAPAVCGEMEQERSAHCVVAGEQKRARIVSFNVKVRESFATSNVAVLALPVPQHLKPRVSTEHGTKPAVAPFSRGKDDAWTMAAKRRPEAVAAAKRRKTAAPNQAPEPKRASLGFDVKSRGKESGVPASATERLNRRMEAELDALGGLLKKAALLSRSVPLAVKADARIAAAKRQPEAPSATKARKSNSLHCVHSFVRQSHTGLYLGRP
jgi:hypothetical protein